MARKKKRRASRPRSLFERVKAAWVARRPIFRFVLGFGVLMALFYTFIALMPFYKKLFFPAYLHFNAELSGTILKALGQEVTVAGEVISSSKGSLSIKRGCDAIEPSALLAAVILAFPAPFSRKIWGLLVGVFFLLSLNLVRIVSLFFIRMHYPKLFHPAHVDWWPVLFILLALVCWVFWIQWASQGVKQHVAT